MKDWRGGVLTRWWRREWQRWVLGERWSGGGKRRGRGKRRGNERGIRGKGRRGRRRD